MLHIYRQITSLRRVRPVVIARKREHAEQFPFGDLRLVKKPRFHFLRRIWFKQIIGRPMTISRGEARALRRVLQGINARLLHVYFGHIGLLLLPLLEECPVPCVVSFHGADVLVDMHRPGYRRGMEETLARVTRVLVRSESLRRAVIELGCAPDKIDIQRTGIPLDQFQFRERMAPAGGAWQLLQACRLIEKKGLATSLRAFARFNCHYPHATLTIAGEGPQLEALQQIAHHLGIAANVRFVGFVSQPALRELFYSSHFFLHPSQTGADRNQEGVPNSMLEAMATGLPVFATCHGGIPEAVEQGENGVLVAEGDDVSLAEALIRAAEAPADLQRMGLAAVRTVSAKFDQLQQTSRLEEIYLQEIAG